MKTALFLGRFQPPHIGHLLTIKRLSGKYRLIVGVTESEPMMMAQDAIVSYLQEVLADGAVSVIPVRGSVEGGTAELNMKFDICCSGNPAVLDIIKELGHPVEYIPRSCDNLFSGTKERFNYVTMPVSYNLPPPILKKTSTLRLSQLKPIERVNPLHFDALSSKIIESQILLKPIIVDVHTHAVLDGSHRYAFLLKYGFEFAPVIMVDYDDESIFVGNYLSHRFVHDNKKVLTKFHVRRAAITGTLLPARTTRHFFPFRKEDVPTSLSDLAQAAHRDISHLLEDSDQSGEIKANQGYIDEIKDELGAIAAYCREQEEVMAWLEQQNASIRLREQTSRGAL
jgi:nicotinamide mononucleotide adenylyltransferase